MSWYVRLSIGFSMLVGLLALARPAEGQGCMPLHFAFPGSVGGQVNYFQAHDWQVGVSFRRIASNRFFVGSAEDETVAPFQQPLHLRLTTLELSLSYATSERFSLSFTVPISYSTEERAHKDGLRHQNATGGIGDLNVVGNYWLAAPGVHPNGNASVGLGLKAPTGRYHLTGDSFDSLGHATPALLTQTSQLGDGGWAALVQLQAFHTVLPRTSAFLSGAYSLSFRAHTDVVRGGGFGPGSAPLTAVPDVYSARLGLAYTIKTDPGISMSLGGRVDGTTTHNLLVSGADDFYRSAGYTVFLDPGLSFQSGPSQFSLNVPIRVHHTYQTLVLSNGAKVAGRGGVNDFAIYAGYTRRF